MNLKYTLPALAGGLFCLAASTVLAQQVPAIETGNIQSTYMPSGFSSGSYNRIQVLAPDTVKLNEKEKQAINLSNQWKSKPVMPSMGENGTVNFVYGATLPSVVCAPLYACDISLQPGETVTQVDVGDAPRWKVIPATSGSADNQTTHLVIKPSDIGLQTNMLVHTDRRMYVIRLASKKNEWTGSVAFSYPDDTQKEWQAYYKQHQNGNNNSENETEALQAHTSRKASRSSTLADSVLDFDYRLSGDSPSWKPTRVYADHNKTYIQFPEKSQNREIPVLVILGSGNKEQLVNYRMVGDRFVVDKIIDKAALITGVGRRQQRVEIERAS
jgi:type IV secretion system protein VirB9